MIVNCHLRNVIYFFLLNIDRIQGNIHIKFNNNFGYTFNKNFMSNCFFSKFLFYNLPPHTTIVGLFDLLRQMIE